MIFLTTKDEEQDEELGLAMGADDYIAKPFSQRLLIARIRAILRRAAHRAEPEEDEAAKAERTLMRGRLTMDPARHRVTWDGKAVHADRHRVPDPRGAGAAAGRASRAATS